MHAWRKSGAPWDRGDAREDEGEEKGERMVGAAVQTAAAPTHGKIRLGRVHIL
ncbi:hypothetical protein DHOM_05710 [Dermabacter hominis 1368]|uniref:Transposase n=1 Tax=Dermabacter hominis 1368 TaxID=1450519 RepID=A0ABR4SKR1_9MICO|nr:hypothetical protein DHOM_05710 [Dermabacter hominis 1368]